MYYNYIYNYYLKSNSPLITYLLQIIKYKDNITDEIINIIKKSKIKYKKNLFHLIYLTYISIIFSYSLLYPNLNQYLYQNFNIITNFQFNLSQRITILLLGVLYTETLSLNINYQKKLYQIYLKYQSNQLINLNDKNNYFKLFVNELFSFLKSL